MSLLTSKLLNIALLLATIALACLCSYQFGREQRQPYYLYRFVVLPQERVRLNGVRVLTFKPINMDSLNYSLLEREVRLANTRELIFQGSDK